MGNSLSQNLSVLPAPSGREPLARPQTLHLSRKLCRYAKGPISEGAGCDQREQTGGVQGATPSGATRQLPQGDAFALCRKLYRHHQKPSPWGRWLDAKRQDGRGNSPAAPAGQKQCGKPQFVSVFHTGFFSPAVCGKLPGAKFQIGEKQTRKPE